MQRKQNAKIDTLATMSCPSAPPESSSSIVQRLPVYYGWVILGVATIGVIMSIPGQTMGVSVFTDDLIQAFRINRDNLALAYMFGTMLSSFMLPMAGRLLDRWGTRPMVTIATIGLSGSLLLLALGPHLLTLLGNGTWSQWQAVPVCFVAFLGVRHFGQGQLTMISRTMLGRWFDGRRGLAFAISGAFVSFGFGAAPFVLSRTILRFGWRESLFILIGGELLMMLVGLLFFRCSPKQCGLEMEQGLRPVQRKMSSKPVEDKTLEQARWTSAFWLFCSALTLQGVIITAVVFHLSAISESKGVDSVSAYTLFLPIALVSTLAEIIGSYLSDRISIKYHLLLMQTSLCVGTIAIVFLGTSFGQTMMVLGLGVSNGMFATLAGVAWPKLFGLKHLGAITGLCTGWVVFGCAFSPYFYSVVFSQTASFDTALCLSALLPVMVLIAALRIKVHV